MSHLEHPSRRPASKAAARELREVIARRGDLPVSELVELAVAHDVPAADLLAVAVEVARSKGPRDTDRAVDDSGSSGSPYSGGDS